MKRIKSLLLFLWLLAICILNAAGPNHGKISSSPFEHSAALKDYSLEEISFIKDLVGKITEEELRKYVQALQDIGTRYAPSQGNLRAANYLKNQFSSFGLEDVSFNEFSYYNSLTNLFETSRNIIASKPGATEPEKIVIIGAHFDSISRRAPDNRISALDKESPAPGADDNATGTAVVLAAARLLNKYDFAYTIYFICFSAEEGGIYGSAHYAAESAKKGEDIIAVINVDMIGYTDQEPEDLDILANEDSTWLLDKIVNNAPIYSPGLLIYRRINDYYDGSDHAPFWNNGYAAICLMEDYYPSSRLYHSPQDTIETLNFSYFLNCTQLAVATLTELAGVHIEKPAKLKEELTLKQIRSKYIDWTKDAKKQLLFTLLPSSNEVEVIDITFPSIHSRQRFVLEETISDSWGRPGYYPVAAALSPANHLVFISMIRERATAKESEQGIIQIFDPVIGEVIHSKKVGRFPMAGYFNRNGSKFYLPYWGERHIDIFDASSLKLIKKIPTPSSINELLVDEENALALGISPENNQVLIINLNSEAIKQINIPLPKDAVLINRGFALVCSYEKAKLYQIELETGKIVSEINCPARPEHLIASPSNTIILSFHKYSSLIGHYKINPSNNTIKKSETLDLSERIVDGTFGSRDNIVYLISSSNNRILGINLESKDIFWAIRTGELRAAGGVEDILYINRRNKNNAAPQLFNIDLEKVQNASYWFRLPQALSICCQCNSRN